MLSPTVNSEFIPRRMIFGAWTKTEREMLKWDFATAVSHRHTGKQLISQDPRLRSSGPRCQRFVSSRNTYSHVRSVSQPSPSNQISFAFPPSATDNQVRHCVATVLLTAAHLITMLCLPPQARSAALDPLA
jgi:hypothetical protein